MASEKSKSRSEKKNAMSPDTTLDVAMDKAEAIEVLAQLYELLEDYGPIWYSEELHYRAEAALRVLRESH